MHRKSLPEWDCFRSVWFICFLLRHRRNRKIAAPGSGVEQRTSECLLFFVFVLLVPQINLITEIEIKRARKVDQQAVQRPWRNFKG